jgi:RNA polymerase sigma-70 factor (ECF subfamily)
MSCHAGLDANARVSGALSRFATEQELEGLGSQAVRRIRAKLQKASLGSTDHVEDVFQEMLLAVYTCCARGEKIENFRSYVLAVSHNSAVHHMRPIIQMERSREELSKILIGEVVLPEEPMPDERSLVLDALSQLSSQSRRIIKMMLIGNLSDDEIRTIEGYEPSAFRVAKHRAIKALRAALKRRS